MKALILLLLLLMLSGFSYAQQPCYLNGVLVTCLPGPAISQSVSSFNGRNGIVVPTSGDYTFSMLGGVVALAQLPTISYSSLSGLPTIPASPLGTANSWTLTQTFTQPIVESLYTPASSTATCTTGTFADDINFHYVCVASNTWKRVALVSF